MNKSYNETYILFIREFGIVFDAETSKETIELFYKRFEWVMYNSYNRAQWLVQTQDFKN